MKEEVKITLVRSAIDMVSFNTLSKFDGDNTRKEVEKNYILLKKLFEEKQ